MGKSRVTQVVSRDLRKWQEQGRTPVTTHAGQAGKFDRVPLGREPVGTNAADLFRHGRKVPDNFRADPMALLHGQVSRHGCVHDLPALEHRPAQGSLIGHAMTHDVALQEAARGTRDARVQPGVYGSATLGRAKEIAREQLTASAVHQAIDPESLSDGAAVGLGTFGDRARELYVAAAEKELIQHSKGRSLGVDLFGTYDGPPVIRVENPEVEVVHVDAGFNRGEAPVDVLDPQAAEKVADFIAAGGPIVILGPSDTSMGQLGDKAAASTLLKDVGTTVPWSGSGKAESDVARLAAYGQIEGAEGYAAYEDAIAVVLGRAIVLERPPVEMLPALPGAVAASAIVAPAITDGSPKAALKTLGETVAFLRDWHADRRAMLGWFKSEASRPLLEKLDIIPGVLAHKLSAKNPDVSSPVIKLLVDLRGGRISLAQFNAEVNQLDEDLQVQRTDLSGGMSGGTGQDPRRDQAEAETGA